MTAIRVTRYVISVTEDGPGYAVTDDLAVATARATTDRAIVIEQTFELIGQEIVLDRRDNVQIVPERECWNCRAHVTGDGDCPICDAAAEVSASRVPAAQDLVEGAVAALLGCALKPRRATYDLGRWWVTDLESGRTWRAGDAVGPGTHYGIGFQEVAGGIGGH